MVTGRSNSRRLLAACLLLCAGGTAGPAFAMHQPGPIKLNGGPLGELEVNGGISGFFYAYSGAGTNSVFGTGKNAGAESFVNELNVTKPAGLLRFTVEAKVYTGVYMGYHPTSPTAHEFPLGPVKLAYLTLAPTSHFKISAGMVPSIEGWESSTDWHNANIIDSPLYYQENSASRGISATYSQGPVSATLVFGDGLSTGVFNYLQGLLTYRFNDNNALSLYFGTNLSQTSLTANAYGFNGYPYGTSTVADYGSPYVNSTIIGGYYDFSRGNLSLVPEMQYIYTGENRQVGIKGPTSNFGAELIGDCSFGKSPWSLGSMVFYYSNHGYFGWYLNPRSAAVGFGITPTYQKGHFYVRGEAALLHMTRLGDGNGFGEYGTGRNQGMGLLEAGFIF